MFKLHMVVIVITIIIVILPWFGSTTNAVQFNGRVTFLFVSVIKKNAGIPTTQIGTKKVFEKYFK